MSFRIVINKPECVGHARCAHFAPDLFKLDESGYIQTEDFEVPAGRELAAFRGARACPERVIKMIDAEGNEVRKSPA